MSTDNVLHFVSQQLKHDLVFSLFSHSQNQLAKLSTEANRCHKLEETNPQAAGLSQIGLVPFSRWIPVCCMSHISCSGCGDILPWGCCSARVSRCYYSKLNNLGVTWRPLRFIFFTRLQYALLNYSSHYFFYSVQTTSIAHLSFLDEGSLLCSSGGSSSSVFLWVHRLQWCPVLWFLGYVIKFHLTLA